MTAWHMIIVSYYSFINFLRVISLNNKNVLRSYDYTFYDIDVLHAYVFLKMTNIVLIQN